MEKFSVELNLFDKMGSDEIDWNTTEYSLLCYKLCLKHAHHNNHILNDKMWPIKKIITFKPNLEIMNVRTVKLMKNKRKRILNDLKLPQNRILYEKIKQLHWIDSCIVAKVIIRRSIRIFENPTVLSYNYDETPFGMYTQHEITMALSNKKYLFSLLYITILMCNFVAIIGIDSVLK